MYRTMSSRRPRSRLELEHVVCDYSVPQQYDVDCLAAQAYNSNRLIYLQQCSQSDRPDRSLRGSPEISKLRVDHSGGPPIT